jgi:hypothetical protein
MTGTISKPKPPSSWGIIVCALGLIAMIAATCGRWTDEIESEPEPTMEVVQ